VLDNITARFETLLAEARRLEGEIELEAMIGRTKGGGWRLSMVPEHRVAEFQAWVLSVANIITLVSLPGSPYLAELDRIMTHEYVKYGVPVPVFQKLEGMLISAKQEWDAGLLRRIEHLVAAETFDDFLDHAEAYHKAGKVIEASVLASAVLEDTVKRVARKNGIDPSGKTLDPLITELAKANVFTPVKAKRYRAAAGIRDKAFHAEWDKIDLKDVGELIRSTRDLIADYL
jgi:uncharacterized protein YutE (UPF0331/DUF86 family)